MRILTLLLAASFILFSCKKEVGHINTDKKIREVIKMTQVLSANSLKQQELPMKY